MRANARFPAASWKLAPRSVIRGQIQKQDEQFTPKTPVNTKFRSAHTLWSSEKTKKSIQSAGKNGISGKS